MFDVVDWSKIIPDILAEIINRLEPIDFIRTNVVCQSWRSIICDGSFFCHPKSDQMPWLLLSMPEEPEVKFLHNPREAASLYKFNLPNISNHVIRGSSGGYIFTIDDVGRVHATNPITKAHRLLPDPTTFSDFGDVIKDPLSGKISTYNIWYRFTRKYVPHRAKYMSCYYRKLVIVPAFNGSMAVLIKSSVKKLVFARENENTWTDIEDSPICNFDDVLVYKGLLYAASYIGQLVVFDIHALPSPKPVIFIKDELKGCRTDGNKYLVESLCGSDIFLIARDVTLDPPDEDDDIYCYHRTIGFNVFKLNQTTKHEWVEVNSFGDDAAVFVGYNQSIMLSVSDLPNGLMRKSCIYFMDDRYAIPIGDEGEEIKEIFCEDMGVYCMETRTVMPLDLNGFDLKRFSFPPPVWFVPIF